MKNTINDGNDNKNFTYDENSHAFVSFLLFVLLSYLVLMGFR